MIGISAAFTGRVGNEPETRYTASGKQLLTFNVAVDQNTAATEERQATETAWVKITVWEEKAVEFEGALAKGTPVYCEGRLKLDRWTKQDGAERSGLSLSAWVVQPMGQIGRRAPRRDRALEPVGVGADSGEMPL